MKIHGLRQLEKMSSELSEQALRLVPALAVAMDREGRGAVDTARRIIAGRSKYGHIPHYPSSITHDVYIQPRRGFVNMEFGPERRRAQGPLGPILEYGTLNNPPFPHLLPAATTQEQLAERRLSAVVRDIVD